MIQREISSRQGWTVPSAVSSGRLEGRITHNPSCLFVDFETREIGVFQDDALAGFTERHSYQLPVLNLKAVKDLLAEMHKADVGNVVFAVSIGYPSRKILKLAKAALAQKRAVYFYWPHERMLECADEHTIADYGKLWLLTCFYAALKAPKVLARNVYRLLRGFPRNCAGLMVPVEPDKVVLNQVSYQAQQLFDNVAPVPFAGLDREPTAERPLPGFGAYLRMDFWTKCQSGGSYGHTCHVAKELARVTENFICYTPFHFSLLDHYGVKQVTMAAPGKVGDGLTLLQSSTHYYQILKTTFASIRPAYIYERLCLGNYVGAWLSQELSIPYIVEYNGSEISMTRSFNGEPYEYEPFYLEAEKLAFEQATLISVVSEPIKAELVARGVDAKKIIVNPNGVDLEEYQPQPVERKEELRREFGWDPSHRVIGFTGTFGGWHGIDVLAKALPEMCKRVPEARILLIGDGNCKHLVDEAIDKHKLSGRVQAVGRVSQREGARLLGACDIYLSPHHKHMVDSRFFGSPTKVFEYMGMGGGIVASDLEQIGEVLSPALRVQDLNKKDVAVRQERAVLCRPGDVAEFIEAVVHLAQRPDICVALGRNARQAATERFSWQRHVANLWRSAQAARPEPASVKLEPAKTDSHACTNGHDQSNGTVGHTSLVPDSKLNKIVTGDSYKDEVQKQWNTNPCGSQYVKEANPHTLEWFLEAERYRYGEYAPWMPEVMEFAKHAGEQVLEIGGGLGTDLSQFAKHGAHVTDVDLSAGHLALAQESFRLRGLPGRFVHHDAEELPFPDGSFDLIYSNGVIHHTPNTRHVVEEIHRVLKPGGRAIIMVYAQNSLHYWGRLVYALGLRHGFLGHMSMGELMSRHVEITQGKARPLVKVYTKPRARQLFRDFSDIQILQRQLTRPEMPRLFRWLPLGLAGKLMGWNLIIKATKGR